MRSFRTIPHPLLSPFMRNLLDFLRKYSFFFLFVLLEIVSMTLLFHFNSFQGSVYFTAANGTISQIDGLYHNVIGYIQLKDINRDLTDKNIALQMETELLRRELAKATRDTSYTEKHMLSQLEGYRIVPARVVSNSAERTNNYLVIDKGESDGIKPEMGVIGGGGAVGIVYLTAEHHSLVIPITNRKSSISCRVRGLNYFGYLQWDGKNLQRASVDDVPRYAKIKKGQAIETSGYSTVFPPGIFVGRVVNIRNSSDGQSYCLEVTLGTNFANLSDVSVVATPYKAEIDSLMIKGKEVEDLTE